MKVYYTASYSFRNSTDTEFYKKTVNYLGFKVGQKNLKATKNDIAHDGGEKKLESVVDDVKNDERNIRECDVFIADITDSSGGVGFQIALALSEKKPILALRHKNDERLIAYGPITSNTHKGIKYIEYETTEEITKVVDKFLEEARAKIDTKFILIIPAEIDKYLNWSSDFRRMHKAQVVREALEMMMKKDKDWKQYQKNSEF